MLAFPVGNYVSADLGNYVSDNQLNLGNYVSADMNARNTVSEIDPMPPPFWGMSSPLLVTARVGHVLERIVPVSTLAAEAVADVQLFEMFDAEWWVVRQCDEPRQRVSFDPEFPSAR